MLQSVAWGLNNAETVSLATSNDDLPLVLYVEWSSFQCFLEHRAVIRKCLTRGSTRRIPCPTSFVPRMADFRKRRPSTTTQVRSIGAS